jgi:hypothetical protein
LVPELGGDPLQNSGDISVPARPDHRLDLTTDGGQFDSPVPVSNIAGTRPTGAGSD